MYLVFMPCLCNSLTNVVRFIVPPQQTIFTNEIIGVNGSGSRLSIGAVCEERSV